MTNRFSPANIHEALTGLGDNVVSVLLPRPHMQTGGEKLRIATKNAAQAIAGCPGDHTQLIDRLTALEMSDMESAGSAFFSAGGDFHEVRLNNPPVAMVASDQEAMWLPVLVDASSRNSAWAVIVDRDQPKIYRATARGLEDFSDTMSVPDYDEIEARREPQLDVLFHSASSGRRTQGHGSFAKFHSLGTTQEQEEEKTEEVFHRRIADALKDGLPRTARKVFFVGDERGAGHVRALLGDVTFDTDYLTSAGDGSDAERLAEALRNELETERRQLGSDTLKDMPPSGLVVDGDVETAGQNGRIETVWISDEAAGLREFADDEYFDFDDPDAAQQVLTLQRRIAPAVLTGANVHVIPGALLPGGKRVLATARYEKQVGQS